jgi:hypothetical protein
MSIFSRDRKPKAPAQPKPQAPPPPPKSASGAIFAAGTPPANGLLGEGSAGRSQFLYG